MLYKMGYLVFSLILIIFSGLEFLKETPVMENIFMAGGLIVISLLLALLSKPKKMLIEEKEKAIKFKEFSKETFSKFKTKKINNLLIVIAIFYLLASLSPLIISMLGLPAIIQNVFLSLNGLLLVLFLIGGFYSLVGLNKVDKIAFLIMAIAELLKVVQSTLIAGDSGGILFESGALFLFFWFGFTIISELTKKVSKETSVEAEKEEDENMDNVEETEKENIEEEK